MRASVGDELGSSAQVEAVGGADAAVRRALEGMR